ncbi:MAG TPA: hypothetical protein VHQ20_01980 [Patescibacteria group bacterium]|jgi:hypothetical protein|nr:hypothetical protein [Patescibacteria group bacterium]
MSNYLLLFEHYNDDKKGDKKPMSFYDSKDEWKEDPKNPSRDINETREEKTDSAVEVQCSECEPKQ